MAHLIAVNRSERREEPKKNVREGDLVRGEGLVGDAHASLSEREVSLIDIEEIRRINRERDLDAGPGSFAENLTVEGLNFSRLRLGDYIRVGPTMLEVVQLGKPRSAAHTYNYKGVSILPDVGIFCRVVEGGHIEAGDPVEVLSPTWD